MAAGTIVISGGVILGDSTDIIELALANLSDVSVTQLANSQYLRYDGSAKEWKNATLTSRPAEVTLTVTSDTSAITTTTIGLADSGVIAGIYTKVTVDSKGRVTVGNTLVAADIPPLDASKITTGIIDAARLPSLADDVLEYANLASFPVTGETGKLYVALNTNKLYRWSGTAYTYITSGAVDSVAGKTGIVVLTKSDVGLSNVDNTSDLLKPVSTATQSALDLKANAASTELSGTPTAPTAALGTDTTQIATTAFVQAEIAANAPTKTGSGATGTWGIDISGNSATATSLQTARTINGTSFDGTESITTDSWGTARNIGFSGDASGTGLINGSADFTTVLTLATTGVPAGTYTKVTVDTKGRVTAGDTLVATDIPPLDASKITTGIIDAARLPSYVDDVLEFPDLASFPVTGATGKIYVALDTNKTYRWGGTSYVYITSGAVDSVAGKTGIVTLVNADVGLGNVDNTTDLLKPVSTATQSALDLKANLASPVFTGNVTGLGISTGTSFNSITGLASASPLAPGTAAVGTSTLAARQDHVHPLQTTITGNADSATSLQTARTINGVSFNGTANITVEDNTKLPLAGGTLTGALVGTTITASSFNATSTQRVKQAITDLNVSYLDKFDQLKPREYDRTDYTAHEFGFIAEEMAQVYPEVVGRDGNGDPSGIDYGKLSTILTAKVQEQQTVIQQLQLQMAEIMSLVKGLI